MAWEGRGRLTTKIGRQVRLGDYMVPRAITWTVTGERGGPDLRFEFAVKDGQPLCTEAHVVGAADGRPVRSSDLAGFNVDSMVTDVFMRFAQPILRDDDGEIESVFTTEIGEREHWAINKTVEDAVKRPRGASDAELLEVAQVYAENPAAPIQAVEIRLGYARRTAARRVAQARERGFLTEENELRTPASEPEKKRSRTEITRILNDHGHNLPMPEGE